MRPATPPDTPIERIRHSLVSLRMPRALETLDGVVQQIERGQISPIEAIDTLLAEEITVREGRRIKAALQMARLATVRTLSGFDFSFQPSLDRNRIMALAGLDFINRHEVVHFIGQSGTGKTHLAVSPWRRGDPRRAQRLLLPARRHHRQPGQGRPRGTPARAHPLSLPRPAADHRRDRLPRLGRHGAGNLFFQLVNARYERGAMILTSNRGFSEWAEVFGDPVVATALLDRLLHHAVVVHIEGASYRLRQHADLFPEAMRQNGLTTMPPVEAPRRRGRPPKQRPTPLNPPFVRPAGGGDKYQGRPSSRPLLGAAARRSGQGMKPLAARGFARPLTAPSTVAASANRRTASASKWGNFNRHFWGYPRRR